MANAIPAGVDLFTGRLDRMAQQIEELYIENRECREQIEILTRRLDGLEVVDGTDVDTDGD